MKQTIVFDRYLGERYPGKGFYLRLEMENGDINFVCLDSQSLPSAKKKANELGYSPTDFREVPNF